MIGAHTNPATSEEKVEALTCIEMMAVVGTNGSDSFLSGYTIAIIIK